MNIALLIMSFLLSVSFTENDHLKMSLEFEGSAVSVNAMYSAVITGNSNSMYFMLNPGFAIESITSTDLKSYALEPKSGRPFPFYKLNFNRELKQGEMVDVSFAYSFDLEEMNHLKSNWIELTVDKLWFPNFNDMDNKFTYDVSIAGFPEAFNVVGDMDALLKRNRSDITIKLTEPSAEVLILAGANMETVRFEDSITFIANRNTPDSILNSMHEKIKNTIGFLNRSFGSAKPLTSFQVVLRNTSSSELGYQTARKNMIITGTDFNSYSNLSHEVAHYWWSDADFIEEPWMNESFANYSMYLVEEEFNPDQYPKLLERYTKQAEKAPPVANATLFSDNAYASYYIKGSILLKELEKKIGRKKMMTLLKARVKKGITTTEGFLSEIEKTNGPEVREYFDSLLNQ